MQKEIMETDVKEWLDTAKTMTPDKFPDFFNHLLEDYILDYGNVCHAMAAVAIAAMKAFIHSGNIKGDITGYQSSLILWDIIRNLSYQSNVFGLKIQNMDLLLSPQYESHFNTIPENVWLSIQKEAQERIAKNEKKYHEYQKKLVQYRKDMENFLIIVKEFEQKHPEYPKYEDNPQFYDRNNNETIAATKDDKDFLYAPEKPVCDLANPDVLAHWHHIVSGTVPFGLKVSD